jgi:hypothetical protein
MGDVSFLPKTGNVMVVYGGAARMDNGLPWPRVREFRHTTPPELVYDVVLADQSENPGVAWTTFGGERVGRMQ